jgi:hypothetical protein
MVKVLSVVEPGLALEPELEQNKTPRQRLQDGVDKRHDGAGGDGLVIEQVKDRTFS